MSGFVRRHAVGLMVVALLAGGASAAGGPAVAEPAPADAGTASPPGLVAGVAVFDRAHQRFLKRDNADKQFRSASLVKVLIAVDHLWDLGPDYAVPPEDRAKLDLMLRRTSSARTTTTAYGANLDRLSAAKRRYDPDNVFSAVPALVTP